jgi:hypothetical protein
MPYISMLTENNVRKGFFELDQFRMLLKHMPEEYHGLYEVAFITGWRIRSELLTRQWRHVDFGGKGSLRLDPGEAKDASTGREFIMTTWLREVLERQQKWVKKVGKANRIVVPWVFCRANGEPISRYSTAWRDLNPIEAGWALQKQHVRKVAPRTTQGSRRVARRARHRVTPHHCRQWFAHARYPAQLR